MYPQRSAYVNGNGNKTRLSLVDNDGDGSTLCVRLGNEVVTPYLEQADTMWRRMKGLLGRGGLAPGEGLWIVPCNSIHMFFMRFPIDAVFLDDRNQVVRVFEDLRPWHMARGGKFAKTVLELPQGKAAFYNIRVGDRLTIASSRRSPDVR